MQAKIKNLIPKKLLPEKVKDLFKAIWIGILKHRTGFFQLMAILLVFILGINLVFYFVSAYSPVCNSCHYMNPYYDQWQKSTHNKIACVECHPNRRILTGAYLFKYIFGPYNSRPKTEVHNKTCLSCHQEKSLHTKTAFKKNILFDHGDHLGDLKRGKKLNCTSCHSKGMSDAHFYVDQNVCYTCHFKGAEKGHAFTGCKVCHGIPQKIISHEGFEFDHSSYTKIGVDCSQCHVEVLEGNTAVDRKRCYTCHSINNEESSEKIHQTHITERSFGCTECHNNLRHGKIKMVGPLEAGCENCHQKLHINQRQMYIGTDAKGIEDTPSRMFAAQVSCEGCHIDINKDGISDIKEKREACIKCHDKNYGPMLDKWIAVLKESQTAVLPVINSVKVMLAAAKAPENAKNIMTNIINNYSMLVNGRGVHNIDYAYKILKYITNNYDTLDIKYFKTGKRAIKNKFISEEKEYCNMCHSLIPAKEISKFKDREFPHKSHSSFLKCSTCHSFNTHKKIEITPEQCDDCHKNMRGTQKVQSYGEITFPHLKHSKDLKIDCSKCHKSNDFKKGGIELSACKSCHHQGDHLIKDCKKCHLTQSLIYNGKLANLSGDPDVMKAGGVECDGCHLADSKQVARPKKEICANCHDKAYESMMDDWQKEIKGLIVNIENLLSKKENPKFREILNKVKKDGSKGVHNYMLLSSELGKIKTELEK